MQGERKTERTLQQGLGTGQTFASICVNTSIRARAQMCVCIQCACMSMCEHACVRVCVCVDSAGCQGISNKAALAVM